MIRNGDTATPKLLSMKLRRYLYIFVSIIAFISLVSPAWAHDLTDREVQSVGTTMEVGVWPDMIYVDYWIAIGDLEAMNFFPLIDTNGDGIISDEEKETFLTKLRDEILNGGIKIKIDDRTDLAFAAYSSVMMVSENKSAPVPLKINFEFLLDLERFRKYAPIEETIGQQHTLTFWAINTLSKPSLTKLYIGQGEKMNIPYTPELRAQALVLRAGSWLRQGEYTSTQFTFEYVGFGEPKYLNRGANITGTDTALGVNSVAANSKASLFDRLKSPALSFWAILIGLIFAFGYGAGHALTPGHGKTLVGAYLIGSRGTVSQAVFLGIIVTVTHLSTVIIAGVIALSAAHFINQTALSFYLAFASAAIIISMGLWMFTNRLIHPLGTEHHHHHHIIPTAAPKAQATMPSEEEHTHDHEHMHEHELEHDHHDDEHHHDHDHSDEHHHNHDDEHHHDHDHSDEHDHDHDDEHHHDHDDHEHDGEHTHDGVHYHNNHDEHEHEHHDNEHHHDHEEEHRHHFDDSLQKPTTSTAAAELPSVSFKQILALGVSGGIVPCPTAIVILLAAITLKKTTWGLFLILAFSLGLASVLIAIGIMMVKGISLAERFKKYAVYIGLAIIALFLLVAYLLKFSEFITIAGVSGIIGIGLFLWIAQIFKLNVVRIISLASPIAITLVGLGIILFELINNGVVILNPEAMP